MRDPDRQGMGRGWIVNAPPQKKDQEATLRSWLIYGPWHPMWSAWAISSVHLRDIEGVAPAKLQFPGATHEFLIVSLESPPARPDRPDPDDLNTWHLLMPPDASVQVTGITDEQAIAICDLMVETILAGNASPDAENRSFWKAMLPRTAAHYAGGLHGWPERSAG